MTAEILCIGTELLLGDIVNTNAAYLARELASLGINVYHQSVTGDNSERLKESIELALSKSDLVITTGGLGPTYDDISKEIAAELFGCKLVLHKESMEMMEAFFAKLGRPMTENNKKQAMMPEGAVVFLNHNGTAPGFALQKQGKTIIMLPGPPREMTVMFQESTKPFLIGLSDGMLVSSTIHIFGMGESSVEQKLKALMESSTNPTLAPYAKEGEVQLRVTAKAKNETEARELIEPMIEKVREVLGEFIYGIDVGDLQTALVQELSSKGLKIATAESCTGGLISKRITEVSGSSEVFGYGACTYANEAKIKLLNVKPETLERFGAVSPQTAQEMAEGIRRLSGADIGISTTGIAGPTGGTDEKPVGLVYVGISSPWHNQVVELKLSRGHSSERELIRWLAASNAINLAISTARLYDGTMIK